VFLPSVGAGCFEGLSPTNCIYN